MQNGIVASSRKNGALSVKKQTFYYAYATTKMHFKEGLKFESSIDRLNRIKAVTTSFPCISM